MINSHDTENTEAEIYQEIDLIKEKLIDLLYWIFSIFMWFGLAGSLYRAIDLGVRPVNYIQIAIVGAFLTIFFIRKKIPYLFKTIFFLFILYVLGTSAMLTFGLFSQGMYFFLLFTIVTGILINTRWGIIVFIGSFVTQVVTSWLFLTNKIKLDINISSYTKALSAWIMAILVFLLVTGIIMIFWQRILHFLVAKIKDTVNNKSTLAKLNKLLSKEIESREKADLLLTEQFEETKILNKEYEEINKQLKEANLNLEKTNVLLSEAKKKTEEADRLKSSFLSNMSHEIRTPMNAIVGFASLIANNNISAEDKKNYLGIIQSSTNSLLDTISDIINMAKIESGQFTIYPRLLDLNEFMDQLEEKFTREIFIKRETSVKVIFTRKFPTPCKIITDIDCLDEIASKLIDNAIKFTEKGKIMIIFSLLENDILNIVVQDSGVGIPKKVNNEIYESFRQIEQGNSRRYGGTGIGLSIAKGLIDLLYGNIEFISSPGNGATFNVSIPVIFRNQPENILTKGTRTGYSNKTFIIVGKNAWENREMNQILQEINSNLIYVDTGFQALDTLKEHPEIEMVVMNTTLPDMSGFQVAKIIKKTYPGLPLLVHIPKDQSYNNDEIDENNCDGMLKSPFDKNNFITTLKQLLVN